MLMMMIGISCIVHVKLFGYLNYVILFWVLCISSVVLLLVILMKGDYFLVHSVQ